MCSSPSDTLCCHSKDNSDNNSAQHQQQMHLHKLIPLTSSTAWCHILRSAENIITKQLLEERRLPIIFSSGAYNGNVFGSSPYVTLQHLIIHQQLLASTIHFHFTLDERIGLVICTEYSAFMEAKFAYSCIIFN
jgi:hypothetical protein